MLYKVVLTFDLRDRNAKVSLTIQTGKSIELGEYFSVVLFVVLLVCQYFAN